MEWNVVYARFNGCKSFKAFDLGEGRLVGNLIYASLLEDTEENRRKLQELSELNSDCGLVLQLRRNGKVVFQTA
jgi:hypothetical protein